MSSNCKTQSARFSLLDRLVAVLPGIHVWGKCGRRYNQTHHGCGGWAQRCPALAKYKFYLALENSLCSEYLTEKLWWNALGEGAVPVVLGGKSARDYAKENYTNICNQLVVGDGQNVSHVTTQPTDFGTRR